MLASALARKYAPNRQSGFTRKTESAARRASVRCTVSLVMPHHESIAGGSEPNLSRIRRGVASWAGMAPANACSAK